MSVFDWSAGFVAGLGYEIVFNLAGAIAFFIVACCSSELVSAFPFPGGCYAFGRCTVGFYPGYLVGCIEIFYYIVSLALSNASIIACINAAFPVTLPFSPFISVFLFVLQPCLLLSKRFLWNILIILAFTALIINFAYIFGAFQYVNFSEYAFSRSDFEPSQYSLLMDDGDFQVSDDDAPKTLFINNQKSILRAIAPCLWGFTGFEYINLMCNETRCPRKDIPWAQMVGMAIVVVFAVSQPILAASMSPGTDILSQLQAPRDPGQISVYILSIFTKLHAGFARIFGLPRRYAILVTQPMVFGFGLTACYSLSKLICSMADSRILPRILAKRFYASGVPVYALMTGSLASLLALLIPGRINRLLVFRFNNVIGVSAMTTYILQLIGFLVMRLKLSPSRFPREFSSPFGIIGAYYALTVCLLGLLSGLCFQPDSIATVAVVASVICIATVYYFMYAKDAQTFSELEKAVILPAHAEIRNANEYFYRRYRLVGLLARSFYSQPIPQFKIHDRLNKTILKKPVWKWNKESSKVVPADYLSLQSKSDSEIDENGNRKSQLHDEATIGGVGVMLSSHSVDRACGNFDTVVLAVKENEDAKTQQSVAAELDVSSPKAQPGGREGFAGSSHSHRSSSGGDINIHLMKR